MVGLLKGRSLIYDTFQYAHSQSCDSWKIGPKMNLVVGLRGFGPMANRSGVLSDRFKVLGQNFAVGAMLGFPKPHPPMAAHGHYQLGPLFYELDACDLCDFLGLRKGSSLLPRVPHGVVR